MRRIWVDCQGRRHSEWCKYARDWNKNVKHRTRTYSRLSDRRAKRKRIRLKQIRFCLGCLSLRNSTRSLRSRPSGCSQTNGLLKLYWPAIKRARYLRRLGRCRCRESNKPLDHLWSQGWTTATSKLMTLTINHPYNSTNQSRQSILLLTTLKSRQTIAQNCPKTHSRSYAIQPSYNTLRSQPSARKWCCTGRPLSGPPKPWKVIIHRGSSGLPKSLTGRENRWLGRAIQWTIAGCIRTALIGTGGQGLRI